MGIASPHGQAHEAHRPVVMGRNGMVSSGHPLASEAGVAILRRGGNAVDAAIGIAAVLGVVEPQASGIGGDGYLMVHRPGDGSTGRPGETRVMNATGPAPGQATREAYPSGIPMKGIRSVSVPGLVDGWLTAHDAYGSLALVDCLAPAIALAEDGFPVTHKLAAALVEDVALLEFASSRAIFAPRGHPLGPGEILKQEDLGETLRRIASEGRDGFYGGPISQAIVEASERLDGLLQLDDFSSYRAGWQDVIQTDYRGYRVCESPPNSSGHVLLQELNLVEHLGVAELPYLSAEAIHLMVEAKRLAFADRERYMADPDWVDIPLAGLLSKDYAAERASQIRRDRAMSSVVAGNPWAFEGRAPVPVPRMAYAAAPQDTTCFVVVDQDRSAVCQLQSIQGSMGSSLVADGTGILLNNRMTYWHLDPDHVDRLEPGKRVRHTMNTVMVFRDDELELVHGTPGADTQVQTNLQVLSAIVDHGLNVVQAVEAPRWRHIGRATESTIPFGEADALHLEARFPRTVQDRLRGYGHPVVEIGAWEGVGSEVAILVDRDNGALHGASDPRRDGYAIGY